YRFDNNTWAQNCSHPECQLKGAFCLHTSTLFCNCGSTTYKGTSPGCPTSMVARATVAAKRQPGVQPMDTDTAPPPPPGS
ncbi:hypothetical protein Q9L58_010790, partial [Maublancomyces gigas]